VPALSTLLLLLLLLLLRANISLRALPRPLTGFHLPLSVRAIPGGVATAHGAAFEKQLSFLLDAPPYTLVFGFAVTPRLPGRFATVAKRRATVDADGSASIDGYLVIQ